MIEPRRAPQKPQLPASTNPITLMDSDIAVTVLAGKGADIVSFLDLATGVDVLFVPPWPPADPGPLLDEVLDEAGWLERYYGGWQLLLPHAGPPREVAGAVRGYHGEASVLPWTVLGRSDNRLRLAVELSGVPLQVERSFEVTGPALLVTTTVRNVGTRPQPVSWVEHPAFGAPFIDEHSMVFCDAGRLLTDADDPGAEFTPDTLSPLDAVALRVGGGADVRQLPGHKQARKLFATLEEFDQGSYVIESPTAGFGIEVTWDPAMFPYAWFWQECSATEGFPWQRQAYAVAIEPANVVAGAPDPARPERGRIPTLAGGDIWRTMVQMSRVELAQR